MEKIHSLTGMIDLIGHKTSKEDISERIFYAEEILRDIFESYSISNPDLAKWIQDNLDFDQLILEFYDGVDPNSGWIHCSYKRDGSNRKDVLTALKQKGKVKYEKGLVGVK